MTRAAAGSVVHFKGSPQRLSGPAQLPVAGPLHLEVSLDLPEGLKRASPFYAQPFVIGAGEDTWLRLSIPASTPPGTYNGTIRIGDTIHDLAVEVEPFVQLRFIPATLVLRGAAGSSVPRGFTLFNTGNTAISLREVHAFGVFDVNGIDDAFGQTFRAELKPRERRLDLFAEALAKGHGGLVRVRIHKGAGKVLPATANQIEATFRLADRMRAGRTYAGTFSIDYAPYGVRIETTARRHSEKEAE